ncbi:MAG: hypothetical protein IJ599_00435 [Alphaproteobacteria bacterium]|nr:hypothetical protein [Alphaproteobacteria bacterium]
MSYNFVIFVKTYSRDFEHFKLMISSFNKHNVCHVPMFVSVPQSELGLFTSFKSDTVSIISDESYAGEYFIKQSYFNRGIGYLNQQVCKLSFWECGFAENYLCVDSEVVFIRDFIPSDFMFDEHTPYTVLVMDKDLSCEKFYASQRSERETLIHRVFDAVGLHDPRLRTCHGNTMLNAKVLRSLKNDFMDAHGYNYEDLLRISPYEFSWYNAWFQKCGLVKEMAVEPFFKTFHLRLEYTYSRLRQLTLEDYAKAYFGVILNGNWKRPALKYKNSGVGLKVLNKFLETL